MNRTEINAYRKQLDDMVKRLRAEQEQLRQEALGGTADLANPKGRVEEPMTSDQQARESMDDEVALSVLGTEEELLAECQLALDRIDRGVFGKCEGCGKVISKKRLDAVPFARMCIRCARQEGQ